MKRYLSYKPSGVEWIGEIPEHWETIRFGMLGIFSSSGIDKKLDDNETSVRMVNYTDIIKSRVHNPIINNQIDFMVVTTPQSKLEEHKLRKGDLVFLPSSETCEDLGVSSLIDFDENDIVYSYHILRFKFLKEVNHYFKKYLGNHNSVYNQFSLEGKGTTRQIIGRNVFRNVKVVLPPVSEQDQIVEFLDEKTNLIDRLISTKERKITLLKEQRISLINEVVTKGLNPNVKMKDSGVEWIGEIPEHWSILKINQFGVVTLGKMLTPDEKEGYVLKPYLRSQNIQKEKVDVSDVKEMWFTKSELVKLRLFKGDLLLNEGGDVGRTCIWNDELQECYIQNSVNRLRFNYDLQEYYLNLSNIYHYVGYYDSIVNRVSIPHLTKEKLESVKFIRPPKNEQHQIVEHLDSKTKEIDELVHLEQKKIDLLKEYRKSLISEVVTGKIKVTK